MNTVYKTVLITGANRGIGRALVDEALKRGATRVYAGVRGDFQHPDARVTPVTLDVTKVADTQRVAGQITSLDLLINNAGIAIYDDLSNTGVIQQHLEVNVLGLMRVTQTLLPQLKRSKGAIVNNLSLAALAPVPVIPGYSISKAAAANITQSLRALLARDGVKVHAAFIGPTDTDMNRGFDIPKASPSTTAEGIFEGLAAGQDDIFPDPASEPLAEGWRQGLVKTLESQFSAFVPPAGPN